MRFRGRTFDILNVKNYTNGKISKIKCRNLNQLNQLT